MTISNVWVRQTLPETLSALRGVGGESLLAAIQRSSLGEDNCSKLMLYDFFAFKTANDRPQFAICGDERNGLSDLVLFVDEPYAELETDITTVCGTLKSQHMYTRLFLTEDQLTLLPGLV